jgi:lantibiotic modifying enzyme
VDAAYGQPGRDHSIFAGSPGVALLHLHIALAIGSRPGFDKDQHLHKAVELLNPILRQLSTRHVTFLCGAAGPLAVGAVVYHYLNSEHDSQRCIKQLLDLFSIVKENPSLPSELLYGRSGYLYALLFVRKHIPHAVKEDLLVKLVRNIIEVGRAGVEPSIPSPLMYDWHGSRYYGAAHGLAGILVTLLQTESETCQMEILEVTKPCLEFLLTQQFPSGNFKSSYGSERDRLVQWCHGSPGFVLLLTLAYKVYGDQRYLAEAEKACDVTWERGLLTKGYGLCHGASGNAYAFLQLFKATRNIKHLNRACKFAQWCIASSSRQCRTPDAPFSLFEGLAGTVYYLVDLVGEPGNAKFPAFEL